MSKATALRAATLVVILAASLALQSCVTSGPSDPARYNTTYPNAWTHDPRLES